MTTELGKIESLTLSDLLWAVELEKDEELWIEATYFDGAVMRGRVRYRGQARQKVPGSNEYTTIPQFLVLDNGLCAGYVKTYRYIQGD